MDYYDYTTPTKEELEKTQAMIRDKMKELEQEEEEEAND